MADSGESGVNYDNIFIKLLSRMADAMLLSIFFVLSCIPVVTIGAAFTALYYTAMKGITGDDGYVWKFYTRSFKQNFKQATGMWMLFLVAFFNIFATSDISTIKVLCPILKSSDAPTLVKILSTTPILAELAGTKLPI